MSADVRFPAFESEKERLSNTIWKLARQVSRDVGDTVDTYDIVSPWHRNAMAGDAQLALKSYAGAGDRIRILDLSCGKGILAGALRLHNFPVVGLDVNYEASDRSAIPWKFWQSSYWHSVSHNSISSTIKGSAQVEAKTYFSYYETRNIPAIAETFDIIIAYAVYEHIEPIDRSAWLSEVVRCLRPGGVLLIACCPRPEAVTERLARRLGIPCHEHLISTDQLLRDVHSADLAVEKWWLSHHLPNFLPGVPLPVAQAYLAAQAGFASWLDDAAGRWTGSRWAHHSNLIARKST